MENNMNQELDARNFIAKKIASYFSDGHVINLGVGLPVLVAKYITDNVVVQAECGLLGCGPITGGMDPDASYFDAAGNTVAPMLGASVFDACDSFGMIRRGKLRATVLGCFQVSQYGDLANHARPGSYPGMGGAMDLVAGLDNVIVATEHCAKDGSPKILKECSFPLTGKNVVKSIITELGVFTIDPKTGLMLREIREGVSIEEIKEKTEPDFAIDPDLKFM